MTGRGREVAAPISVLRGPVRCNLAHSSVWKVMTKQGNRMRPLRVLIVIGALCVLAGVGGIAFFLGDRYALTNLTVKETTPDQIAAAMQNDQFYSDYNEATLVVDGVVTSVHGDGGGGLVEFQTHGGFAMQCQFDQYPTTIHAGELISVMTEGAAAERLTAAVVLRGCLLMGG